MQINYRRMNGVEAEEYKKQRQKYRIERRKRETESKKGRKKERKDILYHEDNTA
jgi:hypothetical protein